MANPRHPLPTLQETLNDKQPLSARLTILIFLIILISVGILGHQNPKISNTYINEGGLIQQVSAGFWFIATAWCAVVSFRTRTYTKEWITGTLFFFLLGFRELDGQKWLTGWNIDKLDRYWNPSIPFHERLILLCLILMLLSWVLFVFPPRRWKIFWLAHQSGSHWTRAILIWILLLGIGMFFDKALHLPMIDQISYPFFNVLRGILEESFEVALAFYTLLLLFPLWIQALLFSNESAEQQGQLIK